MAAGIWILSIFATAWATGGLAFARAPRWTFLVPVLVSAVIATVCLRMMAGFAERSAEDGRTVGRLVGIWSAVEGVAIFVAVNVLRNLGMERLILPAVAIIVGLHFIPLARGIPAPMYYATGSALIVLGLGASLLPGPTIAPTTGLGAATILWATCLLVSASRAA